MERSQWDDESGRLNPDSVQLLEAEEVCLKLAVCFRPKLEENTDVFFN